MIAARVDGFSYYKDSKKSKRYNSQNLVNKILKAFASDKGYNVGVGRFVSTNDSKGKDLFFKLLLEQLKWATGHSSKLRKNKAGSYTVTY